jgi:hypothetical protein
MTTAEQQAVLQHRPLALGELGHRVAELLERRAARKLVDDAALARGDRQLRADRRGALRHAGEDLDAVEADADRPAVDDLVADEQRRGPVRRARGRDTPEQRHVRRRLGQDGEHRIGRIRVGIRKQHGGRGAGEVRNLRRPLLVVAGARDVEGMGFAAVEVGRPHGDGASVLDLAVAPR